MREFIRKEPRIWVAMSGGLDSSTAAALLVRQGFHVEGVFMDLWDCRLASVRQRSSCCSPRDQADAREVANHLGIPLHVVDLQMPFREHVIEPFVRAYRDGRTPNPCILCNQWIKYCELLKMARSAGAKYLATGHYARKEMDPTSGTFRLIKGEDERKDQSYFLFPLQQEQLACVLWPLGEMNKREVRGLAKKWGLPVARKVESQEICFVPDNDYRSFLEMYLPPEDLKPGMIVDQSNRTLAAHSGIHTFTVGQRRGLGISWEEPLYVIRILPRKRSVVVGPQRSLYAKTLEAEGVSWVAGRSPGESFRAMVRVRYRHKEASANVEVTGKNNITIRFDERQRAIAPGQAAVIYQDREVLGGAWIKNGAED